MSEHCVYIYKDIDGNDLYVGQTSDRESRDKQHKYNSPWYESAESVEYIECETAGESLILEAKVISELKPKHNIKIPCVADVESKVGKREVVESLKELEPVVVSGEINLYDIESYIIFNYGSVYAAAKATGRTETQLHNWIKRGDCIDDNGRVWSPGDELNKNGEQVLAVRLEKMGEGK